MANVNIKRTVTLISLSCVLLVLFSLIYYFFNSNVERKVSDDLEQRFQGLSSTVSQYLHNYEQTTQKYLVFLGSTPPIQGIIRAEDNAGVDTLDTTGLSQWESRLQVIFSGMISTHNEILQLRLIDAKTGREQVRVDREFGLVKVRRNDMLQDKSSRDYIKESKTLSEAEIYISPLNLNRERGRVAFPHQATLRIAKPVYSERGGLSKILVVNLDGNMLIEELRDKMTGSIKLIITDASNNVIMHPNPKYQFSADLGNSYSLTSVYQPYRQLSANLNLANTQNEGDFLLFDTNSYISSKKIERIYLVSSDAVYKELVLSEMISHYGLSIILLLIFISIIIVLLKANKRASKLIESQEKLTNIINDSDEGIIRIENDHTISSINAAALRFFPSLSPSIGANISTTEGTFPTGKVMSLLTIIEHDNLFKQEFEYDRNEDTYLISIRQLYSNHVKPWGAAVFIKDVTEQVANRTALSNINKELESKVKTRTEELMLARNEAIKSSELKSQFVSMVSHEMRTPLNGIMGTMSLITEEPLSKKQQYYFDLMQQSSNTLASLINDILDLSKIEAGKLEIDISETNIIRLLESTVESVAVKAQEKNIDLQLNLINVGYDVIELDGHRIKQILFNLCSNAIKFTDKGGIYITAKTEIDEKATLIIEVQDTGIGIAEKNLEKIFDSFSQESSKIAAEFGGTGLGLSISKQLSEMMGGDLVCESVIGEGSLFRFYVPFNVNSAIKSAPLPKSIHTSISVNLLTEYATTFWHDLAQKMHFNIEDNGELLIIDVLHPTFKDLVGKPDYQKAIVLYDAFSEIEIAENSYGQIKKPFQLSEISLLLSGQDQKIISHEKHEKHEKHKASTEHLQGNIVLIVDDNNINIEVAKGMLELYKVNCLTATSGVSAIEQLKSLAEADIKPAMILMDCNMPRMDGYEATKRIRAGEVGESVKNIPIIAMTANAMLGEQQKCKYAGMDDFLPKPFHHEHLIEIVQKYAKKIVVQQHVETIESDEKLDVSTLKSLNAEVAMARLLNDKKLYITICEMFLDNVDANFCALEEIMEKGDSHDFVQKIHALKGQVLEIGAEQLGEALHDIENNAKAGNVINYDQVKKQLNDLKSKLIVELKQYLNELLEQKAAI